MIITIENYTKSYGEKTLFSGVDLSMDPGDKIGIVGVNGTGKSTFLKAVAGLIPVDDGSSVTMRGLRIEYLAQDKEFEPENTVLMEVFRGTSPLMQALRGYELALAEAAQQSTDEKLQQQIMRYTAEIDELDGWQVESAAKTVLMKLGIGDYTAKAGTLSGGQQKRLALARALVQPCDLLLLDELTYMVAFDYLDLDEVLTALVQRPANQHVIITGRGCHRALLELADTVSEVKNVKHAFDAGIKAQKGIDW